ncbi:MAG: halogenase, partial [Xanthomonadales bacterium]|nr:halogenase [Xanthomonadales bacterium]
PGSDFIGISNTYIATLIGKDLAGEAWEPYAAVYEQLFLSFYDSTLAMYRGQYHLFGDAEVLPLKVLWDYSYYWGVLAALFFAGRIGDLTTLSRLKPELAEARALNDALQAMFADWGHRNGVPNADTRFDREFLDQASVDWFAELNRGLKDELDDSAFRQRLRDNLERLRQLARELRDLAVARHPDIDASAIRLPDSGTNHVPLLPMHWHDAQGGTAVGDPALLDQ